MNAVYKGVLGKVVQHPIDHIETMQIDPCPSVVKAVASEVSALCPVTGQPDLYTVTLQYTPVGGHIVESKALKLFLWWFRDIGISCEELAAVIAQRLAGSYAEKAGASTTFHVTVVQQSRGGIVLTAEARA